jgi:hypothetical protein
MRLAATLLLIYTVVVTVVAKRQGAARHEIIDAVALGFIIAGLLGGMYATVSLLHT